MPVLPPVSTHTSTVFLLHGLGDCGSSWMPFVQSLQRNSALKGVKFILPDAPSRPVTLNGGYKMPAWFDLLSLGDDAKEDEPSISEARQSIQTMLVKEAGVLGSYNRLILGGFSQGAAVSLYTSMTSKLPGQTEPLAGCFSLSGWIPIHVQAEQELCAAGKRTNYFFGHGKDDGVVKHAWGQRSAELLAAKCGQDRVTFKTYPGLQHSTSIEETEDFERWLCERVASMS